MLTANTASANNTNQGRNFVINRPYEQVMKALEDPKTLERMLANDAVKVVSFNLNEIELEAEKDIKQDTQWKWHAKATANAHVIVTAQGETFDLHLVGTLYRGDNKAWIDVRTTQTRGRLAHLQGRIEIWKRSENSTIIKLRVYLKARTPCARCRLVRRIIYNTAHNILSGAACRGLCKAECNIRREVERYYATYKHAPVQTMAR